MRIKLLTALAAFTLAATVSAQILVPVGAPNGTAGQSLDFRGGAAHLNTWIPTENLTTYSMSFWLSPDLIPNDESFFLGQTNQGIHLGLRDLSLIHI